MKKINVIGTTGSGKSTFSMLLASKLAYPYIQMDQIYWNPNWVESHDKEYLAKISEAVSSETWVLDGNYSRTNPIKWQNVDIIIWIDYSYIRTFFQLFKRTLYRIITKQEIWPQTGNIESFKRTFLSKDSILIWFFKNYSKNKHRYKKLMNSRNLSHIEFVRLRNPKEAKLFINRVRLKGS